MKWTPLFGLNREQPEFTRGWLVRRSIEESQEHASYFNYAPNDTPMEKLVEVAGSRCAIEECFEQAKQETGLDEYEVRSWLGWYRHITLSMFAHAALAALRAKSSPKKMRKTGFRSPCGKSVGRLSGSFSRQFQRLGMFSTGPHWRRHHQYVARRSHYRRRGHDPPK